MQPYVLGLDIGTGSVKALAVDFSGNALRSKQYFYTTLQPSPGYQEQEPEDVYNACLKGMEQLIKEMGAVPVAVSFSCVMHSIMAVDKEGKPLSRVLLWSDARSTKIAEELRNTETGKALYHRCGTPIHSMSPLCKIIWFQKNLPEVFSRTGKFISIKEYIWFRLFGEYAVDYSLASATGMFDIERKSWDQQALSLPGINVNQLSKPVNTSYTKQNVQDDAVRDIHISSQTLFCIGSSDGCLANLGTYALQENIAAITIGTSGAVRVASSKPIVNETSMTFNYLLDEKIYISGGPVNNGGNILDWLANSFFPGDEKKIEKVLQQIENTREGSEEMIFLPYVHGERAPIWNENASGVFFGVRPQHQLGHFLRAALEGVCFNLRQILELLEEELKSVHSIHASGGFIHSAAWIQMLADITGKNICVWQTEDASALGAAFLVLKSMGQISDYQDLRRPEAKTTEPRKEYQEVYEKNYRNYCLLYPSVQNLMQ